MSRSTIKDPAKNKSSETFFKVSAAKVLQIEDNTK